MCTLELLTNLQAGMGTEMGTPALAEAQEA